jgi:hypothetical protein
MSYVHPHPCPSQSYATKMRKTEHVQKRPRIDRGDNDTIIATTCPIDYHDAGVLLSCAVDLNPSFNIEVVNSEHVHDSVLIQQVSEVPLSLLLSLSRPAHATFSFMHSASHSRSLRVPWANKRTTNYSSTWGGLHGS